MTRRVARMAYEGSTPLLAIVCQTLTFSGLNTFLTLFNTVELTDLDIKIQ